MLKSEFKALTGINVPESVFEVIHKDYMASKLEKQEYCQKFNNKKELTMTKTTLTIDNDLHVTKVCGINVMTNDANNGLGVIELDCKTAEDTRLLISMNLNAVEPAIFAEEIGKTLFGEEVALPYDDMVTILESVTDEPLKSIAQILLNTLTDNRGGDSHE